MLFHFTEPVAKTTALGLLSLHPRFYLFRQSLSPVYPEVMSHLPHRANKCLLTFCRPERITAEGGVQADSNDLSNQKDCVGQNLVLKVRKHTLESKC